MAVIQLEARNRGRRWAALVPFLQKGEFDALLASGSGFGLWDEEPPEAAWQRAVAASQTVPSYSTGEVGILPKGLNAAVKELVNRDVFQREYARKADVRLGLVPLASLITPQPLADLGYVEELADRFGRARKMEDDFAFAFPSGSVPEPMVLGNTVIINDQTANIVINPMAEWRRVEDRVEILITASARPNYMWVADLGGRLVLLNGVHKALAAMMAGRESLPAVIRNANALAELGIQQPASFLAHYGGPRPPLVADFLHPMAIALERRPTRTLTRLIVQVDQIPFPE